MLDRAQGLKDVAAAGTKRELVEVAREYLATYSPREIARLPEECRPARIKSIDDVFYWHQRLVDVYFASVVGASVSSEYQELLTFFLAAVRRAAELGAAGGASPAEDGVNDPGDGDGESSPPPRVASSGSGEVSG